MNEIFMANLVDIRFNFFGYQFPGYLENFTLLELNRRKQIYNIDIKMYYV